MTDLTLDRIRALTGHENNDAVRMALKRARVSATLLVGTDVWPPRKVYLSDAVWRVFSARILDNAETDPAVKELVWTTFQRQIADAAQAQKVSDLFADRLI